MLLPETSEGRRFVKAVLTSLGTQTLTDGSVIGFCFCTSMRAIKVVILFCGKPTMNENSGSLRFHPPPMCFVS